MDDIKKPWGGYRTLDDLDASSVKTKLLYILPQQRLSLQRHEHRNERWVVLEGNGTLTLGETSLPLFPGVAYLIPSGEWHRVKNDSRENLLVIFEVQFGARCDEADIERKEDDYNRI